jgi:glutamate/tyrosine decarboxylase-like PLP-dependent enzyme
MITEFQKHWEEEYKIKTTEELQSLIDTRNRRETLRRNEMNVKTQRDRNTTDETRTDTGDGGDGRQVSHSKQRHSLSFYFKTGTVKRIESKEDRKRFFLISSLLDPHSKSLRVFCDDKHFPTPW